MTRPAEGRVADGRTAFTMLALLAILLLATGLGSQMFNRDRGRSAGSVTSALARIQSITEGQQAGIIARGDDAAERNNLIPVAGLAAGSVAPFRATAQDGGALDTARRCLTQAIYYEAGSEPRDGMRAVAQVVLNRVRHPAYPHSVCGVVYQGWNQPTCQFSFVCDGSLLRTPLARVWREAEEVADEALAGATDQAVGSATSYHADYVLPRWAYTLPKITQVGVHIFYRLPGKWGTAQALSASWTGSESIPQIDLAGLRLKLPADSEPVTETAKLVPGLTVTPLVSDRHAPNDVGGRLDTTKAWRLEVPLPADLHQPLPATNAAAEQVTQGARVS